MKNLKSEGIYLSVFCGVLSLYSLFKLITGVGNQDVNAIALAIQLSFTVMFINQILKS